MECCSSIITIDALATALVTYASYIITEPKAINGTLEAPEITVITTEGY